MVSTGIAFRLISGIMLFISYYICLFLRLISSKKRQLVPRSTDPLFSCSAREIALKIRRKQVTSQEVVSTFIKRIQEVNPLLNAVVQDRFEDALKDAIAVDEYISSTDATEDELEKTKPLLGVPVTIKENLSIKGMSLTVGALKRVGIIAEEDGESVKRMRNAGAIPLCATNTPEYCVSIETYNKVTGATNNPYNTLHNSGGSSGGEGALIGSGASTCGIGSDIGGSIRIPAAFNGIFGHKPSPGLVSVKGHFPTSTDPRFLAHLTIGPMARYSEDLEIITKVLAGPNADRLKLDEPVKLSQLKVLHMVDCGSTFGLMRVQEEIKEAIKIAADHLRDNCFCEYSDVKFEEMACAAENGVALHFAIKDTVDIFANENLYLETFKALRGRSKFAFNTLIYGYAEANKDVIPGTIEEHEAFAKAFKEKIINELGDNGVFLFPSFPTSAIPHMGSIYATMGGLYCLIVNILGLPSTNVPCGFDKKGLPIGIQVIAAPDQDRLCFAVAKELETVFGGWKPPY